MDRKKAGYNVISGFGSQIIIIVLGLIIPRIFLTNYGSDTNGLTSTVTQIFAYMALFEAGIGQATRNVLYAPVKGNDKKGISYVMSVSRRYYRKITVYYGLGVVFLALLLPLIIKSHINYWTIFFLVIFEGMTQVISFWFTQNWMQILMVSGENYIKVNAEMLGRVGGYGIKIVMAYAGLNIAIIQFGYFVLSLIKLVYYYYYMKRHYDWIDYSAAPKDAKLPARNSFIITEIAWTIFSSTDLIILSMFCSTELASVYAIYNMVFSNVNSLLNSVYLGTHYILGQTYSSKQDDYIRIHDSFTSIFVGSITILMSTTYILILPFIKLYTKGITDINYIYTSVPLFFCMIQILSWSRFITGNLTALAGYAKQTSRVSVIEAFLNIAVSLVLVSKFQLVGVLCATVVALPFKVVYCAYLSDKVILKRNFTRTISILGVNYGIFAVTVYINNFLSLRINSYFEFLFKAIAVLLICLLIGGVLNIVVNRNLLLIGRKIIKRCR